MRAQKRGYVDGSTMIKEAITFYKQSNVDFNLK